MDEAELGATSPSDLATFRIIVMIVVMMMRMIMTARITKMILKIPINLATFICTILGWSNNIWRGAPHSEGKDCPGGRESEPLRQLNIFSRLFFHIGLFLKTLVPFLDLIHVKPITVKVLVQHCFFHQSQSFTFSWVLVVTQAPEIFHRVSSDKSSLCTTPNTLTT